MIESLCLLYKLLLDGEQVPILPDGLQEVVEELIELFSQVVSDEDDVVSDGDLVLTKTPAYLLVQDWLLRLDFLQ